MGKNIIHHLTDQELLEKFRKGHDTAYLGVLFERYTLLLLGVCYKYLKNEEEAKDAVQQVFLKATTELQKYPVTYFKSWIYMIARNFCFMQLRNKGQYNNTEINDNTLSTLQDTPIEELLVHEMQLDLLEAGLATLNSDQKLCIQSFYLEKKPYLQISEETGLTVMQVKSNIQNGKRNLRIFMEKQNAKQS